MEYSSADASPLYGNLRDRKNESSPEGTVQDA